MNTIFLDAECLFDAVQLQNKLLDIDDMVIEYINIKKTNGLIVNIELKINLSIEEIKNVIKSIDDNDIMLNTII